MTLENFNVVLLPSAARTAAVNTPDQNNLNARGVIIIIDVTAETATPIITPKIQGKDPASGKYYDILESAAISTVSTKILKVYPGLTAVANLVVSDILPRIWRVSIAVADTDSMTYSVGAVLIN